MVYHAIASGNDNKTETNKIVITINNMGARTGGFGLQLPLEK